MTPPGRPPAASTDFDGTRLTVARRLRAKTKTALAREIGVTATAIGQYEKGASNPTQAVLAQLCLSLGLPREFFGAGRPITLLPATEAHFRSLRATSAIAREQALAYGEVGLEVVDLISKYVDLPDVRLPDLAVSDEVSDSEIEAAAASVRDMWDLGTAPIPSVVQSMEANGIVVLRLPPEIDRAVDAFSVHSAKRPMVLLSPVKNDRARSRFDAAHELGHLILHPDTEPGSKLIEKQAHRFASELLMPRREILRQLPRRINWPELHRLKSHWGVSLRALVYRSHALGVISEASYRRANQQLAVWGLPEPGDLGPAESPQLLGLARKLLIDSGVDFQALLAAARIDNNVTSSVIAAGTEPKLQLRL